MVSGYQETHSVCLVCMRSSSHLALVIFCSPKFGFCQELSSVLLSENDCSTVREFLGVVKHAHPRLKTLKVDVLDC